jgi:hypothetical protein
MTHRRSPGASDSTETVVIPKTEGSIDLDGHVREAAWEQARTLPVSQHRPDFGEEPTEQTEILITYNENYIYAACRCYDDGPLTAPSFKRDYITGDSDLFALIFDTFNDNETAVAFMTAPTGLRADLAVSNNGTGAAPLDVNWNSFWAVETRQTDDGWFVEMRIPVSSLRFQPRQGKVVMGLSVGRLIARKSEDIVYPEIPPKWGGLSRWRVSRFQDVVFRDLSPETPLRFTPYVLAGVGRDQSLNQEGTAYRARNDFLREVGLDVKYGLTSNLTLDLTVNTDFAQVEADNQQVNLTRFPLFFPEKRRFFKERASNFSFTFGGPNRLFYSRRIGLYRGSQVRILGGARAVGRQGSWDIGVLNMQTARESDIGPEGETLPSENFGVLRLQREVINAYSNVGGILTSRVGLDGTYNVAYGLDGLIRVVGDDYVTAKWAQTFDDVRSNEVTSIEPARIQLRWERRAYEGLNYSFRYARAGAQYDPGIGFELRDDYFRFGDRVGFGWVPGQSSSIERHRLNLVGNAYFRNRDGSLESLEVGPEWEMTSNMGHSLTLRATHQVEDLRSPFALPEGLQIPAGRYTFQTGRASYQMPSGWPFRSSIDVTFGSFFNGRRGSIEVSPTWNVSQYLRVSGTYQFNRLQFSERGETSSTHLSRLRLEVTPSVEYTLSGFIQHNSARDIVVGNVRFRYNPRQGNDFYLAYNEQVNLNRDRRVPPLPRSGQRAIILKYNYTFSW